MQFQTLEENTGLDRATITDIHNNLISGLAICLSILISALCLRIFGTTPGKFANGIFVRI